MISCFPGRVHRVRAFSLRSQVRYRLVIRRDDERSRTLLSQHCIRTARVLGTPRRVEHGIGVGPSGQWADERWRPAGEKGAYSSANGAPCPDVVHYIICAEIENLTGNNPALCPATVRHRVFPERKTLHQQRIASGRDRLARTQGQCTGGGGRSVSDTRLRYFKGPALNLNRIQFMYFEQISWRDYTFM